MPIYEFKCQACAKEFEVFLLPRELKGDPAIHCPACESSDVRKRITEVSITTQEMAQRNWSRARQRWIQTEHRDKEMSDKEYIENHIREESDIDPDPRAPLPKFDDE